MKSLLAAFQFLTTLPLPLKTSVEDFGKSVPWFPLTGLFVGAGAALVFGGLSYLEVPPLLVAVLTVLTLTLLSGALHLDGVADSFDGLFSHRDRECMLEIMRDSAIGTMGVLGLVFIIILKISALFYYSSSKHSLLLLILIPTIARGVMALGLYFGKYVRTQGMATEFLKYKNIGRILLLITLLAGISWWVGAMQGLVLLGIGIGVALLFNLYVYRKIGGITGDTLGATSEIVETVLFMVPLLLGWMG